jgi:hypothetical protein
MPRQIKVIYDAIPEEPEATTAAEQPSEQEEQVQEQNEEVKAEPPEDPEEPVEPEQTKPKSKSKRMLDMPTTNKILEQVECQACGRKMSAKNLKYSHAKYCTERNQEPQPEDFPVPQIEVKNNAGIKEKKSLPVKPQRQPKLKTTTTHRGAEQEEEEQEEHEIPQKPPKKAEDRWKETLHKRREVHLPRYKNLFTNAC